MLNILIDQFKVPFYFGGTSLLILVRVALDTAQQIQSQRGRSAILQKCSISRFQIIR